MTAIVAPQPLPAPRKLPQPPAIHRLASPIYLNTDLPRRTSPNSINSPRLMSPSCLGDPKSLLSKPVSNRVAKRRRAQNNASGRVSRRRNPNRPERAQSFANGPSMFDQLSWISQLQATPPYVDLWDIADLSLLPVQRSDTAHPSCVGPERSRRSSLRSDPLASAAVLGQQDHTHRHPTPARFPFINKDSSDPRTPPPYEKYGHDARFSGLLPALPVYEDHH